MINFDMRCVTWKIEIFIAFIHKKKPLTFERNQCNMKTQETTCKQPYCKWYDSSNQCRPRAHYDKLETIPLTKTVKRSLDTGEVVFNEHPEKLSMKIDTEKNRRCLGQVRNLGVRKRPKVEALYPLDMRNMTEKYFVWTENDTLDFTENCKEFEVILTVYNLDREVAKKHTWSYFVSFGNQTLPKVVNGTLKFDVVGKGSHFKNCQNLTMLKLLCYTADDEESSFHIEGLDIPQKRIEKYERCKAIPYLKLGTSTVRSKGNNDEIAKTMSSREKYGSASLWFTQDGKQFLEDSTIIPVLVGSILSGLVILLGATGKVELCENLKNMLSIIILRCYCCEDLLQEKGHAN